MVLSHSVGTPVNLYLNSLLVVLEVALVVVVVLVGRTNFSVLTLQRFSERMRCHPCKVNLLYPEKSDVIGQ